MSTLLRTPLYFAHLLAKAKMVDFSGWEMPLHYGSQLAEHEAVRTDAGMFDVSHMCPADFAGADAKRALQVLMANDVAKLAVGQALYTAMLSDQGGCIDDLIVYRLAANQEGERYRIVHNAGRAKVDIEWIQTQIQQHGWKVTYQPRRDLAMIAIQGPHAVDKALSIAPVSAHVSALSALGNFQALEGDVDHLYARTGYTGEDGMEWMIPASSAELIWQALLGAGVRPCGLGARDTLRLEAGMCLFGQDLDTEHTPFECGIGWSVAMKDDRAFIGRLSLEQKPPQVKSLGLILRAGGVLRAHLPVRIKGSERMQDQGEITSGGFSPTLKLSIGLARLPLAVNIGDVVEVQLRGTWLPCEVVKANFVRHGLALVR